MSSTYAMDYGIMANGSNNSWGIGESFVVWRVAQDAPKECPHTARIGLLRFLGWIYFVEAG
jgi:hypothetical protein